MIYMTHRCCPAQLLGPHTECSQLAAGSQSESKTARQKKGIK